MHVLTINLHVICECQVKHKRVGLCQVLEFYLFIFFFFFWGGGGGGRAGWGEGNKTVYVFK